MFGPNDFSTRVTHLTLTNGMGGIAYVHRVAAEHIEARFHGVLYAIPYSMIVCAS